MSHVDPIPNDDFALYEAPLAVLSVENDLGRKQFVIRVIVDLLGDDGA